LYNIWIIDWNNSKCIFQEQNVEHLQGKPHVLGQEIRSNVEQLQELEEEKAFQSQRRVISREARFSAGKIESRIFRIKLRIKNFQDWHSIFSQLSH